MSHNKGSVGIYTLGCKVNQYESEAIAEACSALGLAVRDADEPCDAYIINTCTVTSEADRKARQLIRRALSRNPEAYIIVTGCLAQIDPASVASIKGVDFICGNDSKLSAAAAAAELIISGKKNDTPAIFVNDISKAAFEQMRISSFNRTRACVKIEDGCESHCAYCIIPSARGKIRSKPEAEIISEVTSLTAGGCREVVLTGIETAAYGRDLPGTDLASLLSDIDRIDGIGRVRLGSLDPSLLKPDFIGRISGIRSLAPHFHLSVQSGSDRVLGLMKRKYNTRMVLDSMERLRGIMPGVMFTADMIVGFPQESEDDFNETLRFIEAAKFLSVHVFTYSRRVGTVAAAMTGQIPEQIKKLRSASLIDKQSEIKRDLLLNVISSEPVVDVLFETYCNGCATGHTASFIEVSVSAPERPESGFIPVRLTQTDGGICTGTIISERKTSENEQ